ncbi:hypothetical protein [Staphylococcus epidermidis]|uniref:hypothetical protein n=1 Tax=Staphylococcus epidermidis TaxID=1282 RepID=UPI00254AFB27|nr:hypothetical protein [Staphylococcus epidermidis]MDK7902794.1 hypothetical protein [Staphylococcus epidermidis]MDK8779914.1 hypothetical protein [Staphylococcus epidermidis]WJD66090.1 hypothetical protein QQ988_09355 [Staphylococcus epidermidis]
MELFLDQIFDTNNLRMDDETFEEFLKENNLVLTSNTAKSYRENLDTLLNEKNMAVKKNNNSSMFLDVNEKWGIAA